jgi:hypothetical protein
MIHIIFSKGKENSRRVFDYFSNQIQMDSARRLPYYCNQFWIEK